MRTKTLFATLLLQALLVASTTEANGPVAPSIERDAPPPIYLKQSEFGEDRKRWNGFVLILDGYLKYDTRRNLYYLCAEAPDCKVTSTTVLTIPSSLEIDLWSGVIGKKLRVQGLYKMAEPSEKTAGTLGVASISCVFSGSLRPC